MSTENPYSTPQSQQAPIYVATALPQAGGLWRKGNLLVMHRAAQLPPRCVKSNVPVERTLKRELSWHHPTLYLTVLINLVVYIVLAIIFTKKATVYVGLSDAWFAYRRRAIFLSWTLIVLSLAAFIGSLVLIRELGEIAPATMGISVFVLFASAIYGIFASRIVVAKFMDDNYIHLRGVCDELLADLPEWPYP